MLKLIQIQDILEQKRTSRNTRLLSKQWAKYRHLAAAARPEGKTSEMIGENFEVQQWNMAHTK